MIVEKRADGKVETEATIKIWVGGERYVRTAEGNGPVNALDRALRDAIGEIHPHLQRHRARQLQGPHPRRDEGHRRGHARADRRLRRPRRVGLDRRLGEPDRGLLGRARRLARVRHAGRAARRRSRRSARAAGCSGADAAPARASSPRRERTADLIPLARPVLGEAEEQAVLEVLRSGQLSLGPRVLGVRAAFAARVGAPLASACQQRHRRAAPRAARGRGGGRGRGRHEPVLVRRLGQRRAVRARAAGVRGHRPGDAQPRPGRRPRPPSRERTRALLPVHIFGYPADMPAFERLAGRHGPGDRRGRLRGARRGPRRRRRRSAGAAIPRCSASTPTSS